jgi:threonine/homoserine/homoserine lactone efflux protein
MLAVIGTGLAGPLTTYATLHLALKWVGAAWMLLLAWKIAVADTSKSAEGQAGKPPLSFFGAVLFQWINPKAWMIALATAATYTTPDGSLYRQVAVLALISFLVCLPCVMAWAFLGASAGRLLADPRHLRLFNTAMALLLVISLVPMLAE